MIPIEEYAYDQLRRVAIDGLDELPHGGDGLDVQCPHNIDELEGAEPPLSAFVLGDERLRLVETRRDIGLRQPGLLPKVAQQLAELDLAGRAQRIAHCGKPGSRLTAAPHNPGLGLSQFGICL